ncbi:MAG: general stress protein [bacterium]
MTSPLARGGAAAPMTDIDLSNLKLVVSYREYASAQKFVDSLSDRGFDVSSVSIVGSGLLMVEKVVGRLTTARAAMAGAASGLWFGVFLGLLFGLATPYFWGPLLYGIVLGVIFGAVFGALGHAALRGTRDFASTRTVVAQQYDVLATAAAWEDASSALAELGQTPRQ